MTPVDPQFEALVGYLKEARGFDFTGYKRSSLMRRVQRRMDHVGMADYGEYQDFLQVRPGEFTELFNTILINVTGFFRDADAWDYLRGEVVEPLISDKPAESAIRIWSAGCASGEEAYTLAILFAELLGPDEYRRRVKIYATDVDEEGLSYARQATYTSQQVRGVPPALLERHFDSVADQYVCRSDLRRSVIFGRNDLVQDAPISRIDLLVCRNTLMYFNAETQTHILSRFHFALADEGILFLGKAEMLLGHSSRFAPLELKRRVFRKISKPPPHNGSVFGGMPHTSRRDDLVGLDGLRNEAFLASPVAQVVVTSDGLVALTNRQAESMFGISSRDIGRPFRDLELSYRPVELRKYIEQAQVERRTVTVGDVDFRPVSGDEMHLEVQLDPLVNSESSLLGVALTFHDVTAARKLQHELEQANRQLETAYEKLQSTNEELETTNEELQSTVEELETTNEELQSTNEELETMNEELQSSNDEMQNTNDQLRRNTLELDLANAFLDAVLTSLRAGVIVINQELEVQAWNHRASDLWGLRQEEVLGQHLLNLDFGLPIDQLRPMIRRALAGDNKSEGLDLEAVNRRGRQITIRAVCTPLAIDGDRTSGAILVMEQLSPAPDH